MAHLVLIGDGEYGVARTLCVGADSRYTPPGRLLFVLTPVKLGRWFPYGPTKRAVGLIIDWRDTWVRRNFALGSSDFVLVLAFFFGGICRFSWKPGFVYLRFFLCFWAFFVLFLALCAFSVLECAVVCWICVRAKNEDSAKKNDRFS